MPGGIDQRVEHLVDGADRPQGGPSARGRGQVQDRAGEVRCAESPAAVVVSDTPVAVREQDREVRVVHRHVLQPAERQTVDP
jgi:hypothetical protein